VIYSALGRSHQYTEHRSYPILSYRIYHASSSNHHHHTEDDGDTKKQRAATLPSIEYRVTEIWS
jgi:hypothetical protein